MKRSKSFGNFFYAGGKPVLENVFFVLALVLGSIYLLLTPPCASPDEQNHFYKGWSVSQGNFFAQRTADHLLGESLPVSLLSFAEPYATLRFCDSCRITDGTIKSSLHIPLNKAQKAFVDFANTGFYAPIGYIPQAVVYKGCSIANISPGYAFYLGRIAMFGMWLLCGWIAIRITPVFKDIFLLLLLLPASLAFHMSLNPDVLLHGLGFLFFGLVFKVHFSQQSVRIRQLVLLSLLMALITIIKPNLVFLGILLFLLPIPERLYKKWRIPVLILSLVPAVIALLFMQKNSSARFIPYDQYHVDFRKGQTLQPGADPMPQMHYIIDYPGRVVEVFVRSWMDAAPSTIAHYIGKFGWYHHYLPGWIMGLLLIGLLVASQRKKVFISWRTRVVFFVTGILLTGIFSVTMYMLWTPVGHPELLNLQGRYFVLIFPLFIMSIQGIYSLKAKSWNYMLGLLWVFANLVMIGQVYLTQFMH
jgi:uncharacterized membrane protein